ncbi:MAG: B12-binding domain-containing radical SAM protein [Candidatus Micrarchaeia archaeon]
MDKKIAIIKPKDTEGEYFNSCYRAVDIGEIAGSLRDSGIQVSVFDEDFQQIPSSGEFDQIAMYLTFRNTPMWLDSKYVDKIRAMSKNGIVAYGEPASISDISLMKNFDYVVRGGDWGLGILKAMEMKNAGRDSKIVSVPFDKSGNWAMPALDLLPMDAYRTRLPKEYAAFTDMIAISGSKGCGFGCAFCIAPKVEGPIEIKSNPKRIIDFFEKSAAEYKKPLVTVFGPNFLINRKWAEDVCEGLIENKNSISWKSVTAPKTVTAEMLELMSKAGCYQLGMGVETFSKNYPLPPPKRADKEEIKKIIRACKDNGIAPEFFIIRGLPGVTDKETDEDIEFIVSNEGIVRVSQYMDYDGIAKEYETQGSYNKMVDESATLGKRWRIEAVK